MLERQRRLVETGVLSADETDGVTLVAGDHVRLKFALPNGQVEILDGDWISVETLPEDGPGTAWIVVRAQGKLIWKPIAYLVQVEVLEPNEDARRQILGEEPTAGVDGYHG